MLAQALQGLTHQSREAGSWRLYGSQVDENHCSNITSRLGEGMLEILPKLVTLSLDGFPLEPCYDFLMSRIFQTHHDKLCV